MTRTRQQRSDRPSGPVDDSPVPGTLLASVGDPGAQRAPNDLAAAEQWAQSLLREVGVHVTRGRVLVLATLRGRERPVTALDLHQELAARMRESGAVPGVTTVYRALTTLAERGVLHCFPQDRAVTAYRLCRRVRHLHLLCRSCGRVQEQPPGPEMDWAATQVTTAGFAIEDYRAELVGLCATCRPDSAPRPADPTDHPAR